MENITLLMHVPLHLTVEIGSAKMSVAEILKLGTGSSSSSIAPLPIRSICWQTIVRSRGARSWRLTKVSVCGLPS